MLSKENTASNPKFPQVTSKLTGENENTLNFLSVVSRDMRQNGIDKSETQALHKAVFAAQSGDEALQILMRTVNVI